MTVSLNQSLPSGHTLIPVDGRYNRSYELVRILGQGGFAYVYKANDHLNRRTVAIKELFPHEYVQRSTSNHEVSPKIGYENFFKKLKDNFANEARHITQVNNPYVVQIIDTFVAHNTFYFAMPYLDGLPLDKYVGRLSEKQIKHLLYCAIEGLIAIHKAGLVHRDITPGNIFICNNLSPIIIDLGSARHANNMNMTQILTPGFAAPEQSAKDTKNVKQTSDIYGMAATFYYVITRDKPKGQPASFLRQALLNNPLGAELGAEFIGIFASALELESRRRPSNAHKWLNDLRAADVKYASHSPQRSRCTRQKNHPHPQNQKYNKSAMNMKYPAFVMGDPVLTTMVIVVALFFLIMIIF